jgi:hypothetical protein
VPADADQVYASAQLTSRRRSHSARCISTAAAHDHRALRAKANEGSGLHEGTGGLVYAINCFKVGEGGDQEHAMLAVSTHACEATGVPRPEPYLHAVRARSALWAH